MSCNKKKRISRAHIKIFAFLLLHCYQPAPNPLFIGVLRGDSTRFTYTLLSPTNIRVICFVCKTIFVSKTNRHVILVTSMILLISKTNRFSPLGETGERFENTKV